MSLPTGCMLTSGSSKPMQFLLACTRARSGQLLSYNRARRWTPVQKWLLTVVKRILGVRDTTPSWCVMRECGLEPLQFNCFCATMRLYNSLTQFRILLGTSERERERERERDTRSFGHPTLPNGCPREHNSKTLITDGVHYKISLGYSFSLQPSQVHVPRPPTRCHSQCWPFQTACPHPSL